MTEAVAGRLSASRRAPPGFWRLNGINAFWAANQGLWNAVYVLLAVSAAVIAPDAKELVVGRATAAGGALSVLVPLGAGFLSDRTRSRWGRRTPWIVGGAVTEVTGLVALALAGSVPMLILAYLLLQIGNNCAGAAFAGIVPDVVPAAERGRASGLLNSATAVGTVACLAIALVVLGRLGSTAAGSGVAFVAIAALVAASLCVSIMLLREAPHPPAIAPDVQEPRRSLGAILGNAWRDTLAAPDFRWLLITRFFQTLGIWTILPFITFYFQDVVQAANYGAASSLWLLVVLAGGIVPAIACGYLSDRIGRRKPFVYASSAVQAVVAAYLLFSLASSLPLVYALGLTFGVGYGAFAAVDWALVCDVLPDPEEAAASGMSIFHVSFTLPQVLAPAILAPILHALNHPATHDWLGYRWVFGSAALWFVLATVFVSRIRGVR
ncbi:MAG: MFS transporter [Candidatus Dormibacteraeota bacterium]|nr:MFS transporter [Candidatus Dormibacteraeota bacterium]